MLDTHDKVVLAGMPYSADKIVVNPGALRALGQAVLNPDPLIRTAGLAALGDRNNYGSVFVAANCVEAVSLDFLQIPCVAFGWQFTLHVLVQGIRRALRKSYPDFRTPTLE